MLLRLALVEAVAATTSPAESIPFSVRRDGAEAEVAWWEIPVPLPKTAGQQGSRMPSCRHLSRLDTSEALGRVFFNMASLRTGSQQARCITLGF